MSRFHIISYATIQPWDDNPGATFSGSRTPFFQGNMLKRGNKILNMGKGPLASPRQPPGTIFLVIQLSTIAIHEQIAHN